MVATAPDTSVRIGGTDETIASFTSKAFGMRYLLGVFAQLRCWLGNAAGVCG
jgi:hypothetical protein